MILAAIHALLSAIHATPHVLQSAKGTHPAALHVDVSPAATHHAQLSATHALHLSVHLAVLVAGNVPIFRSLRDFPQSLNLENVNEADETSFPNLCRVFTGHCGKRIT